MSIIIADDTREYYFNFKAYEGLPKNCVLEWHIFRDLSTPLFLARDKIWYMHNAKFDLAFLATEEIVVTGRIHDTMVAERLLDNNALSISLKNVGAKYGLKKSDEVQQWLDDNEAYEKVLVPGKKRVTKKYFWDRVPIEVLAPYGCQDARITYQLGNCQRLKIKEIITEQGDIPNKFKNCYTNEMLLVKTVFHMEHSGILLDTAYCIIRS